MSQNQLNKQILSFYFEKCFNMRTRICIIIFTRHKLNKNSFYCTPHFNQLIKKIKTFKLSVKQNIYVAVMM